jgi:hypothetical protein
LLFPSAAAPPPAASKHKTDWVSLTHSEFDLPGISVGASRRRPGDNAGMTTIESAVKMIAGDSGTANDPMMEVEAETSVTESDANLQPQSTVGIDPARTQDMEEEEVPMTAIPGTQARQFPNTPAGDATRMLANQFIQ